MRDYGRGIFNTANPRRQPGPQQLEGFQTEGISRIRDIHQQHDIHEMYHSVVNAVAIKNEETGQIAVQFDRLWPLKEIRCRLREKDVTFRSWPFDFHLNPEYSSFDRRDSQDFHVLVLCEFL